MRQIKFKGKTLKSKVWVFGYYYYNGSHVIVDSNHVERAIDPETLGQYVGYIDKEKNEVYQGDVLGDKESGRTFVVVWSDFMCGWRLETKNEYRYNLKSFPDAVKIGNRHDNPDLIGVE